MRTDGTYAGKLRLEHDDAKSLGDGITVRYEDGTYTVRLNETAARIIDIDRGELGTRYGNGEKITIRLPDWKDG